MQAEAAPEIAEQIGAVFRKWRLPLETEQAQAFAVVVELIESEKVTREEWADRLGAELKAAEERGEYDSGVRYYDHWLAALEGVIVEKELAGSDELSSEKQEIKENDHHRREHQLKDVP